MPINKEQREARRCVVGASDAAAILGLDRFRTPQDVWASKVYDTDDFSSDAADAGNRVEHVIIDWCAEQLGRDIKMNVHVKHPNMPLAVNLDGMTDDGEGVEAKSTGMSQDWGAEGTDQVPERVLVQVHVQAYVAGLRVVHVPVLFAERGLRFKLYRVAIDPELSVGIVDQCMCWWDQYVVTEELPPASVPSIDILSRIRRTTKTVTIDDAILLDYDETRTLASDSKKVHDRIKAEVIAALDDAEGATSPAGHTCTYKAQTRLTWDTKRLRADHPELVEQYTTEKSSRVLRVQLVKDPES